MRKIADILDETVEILETSGLPKPSRENKEFFIRLITAARVENQNLSGDIVKEVDTLEIKYLIDYINQYRRRNYLASNITEQDRLNEILIQSDNVSITNIFFMVAQKIPNGNVTEWLKMCRDAERKYKKDKGGPLPRTFTQIKSDIKRMMKNGINLNNYQTYSEAKRSFLSKEKK